MKLRKYQQEAIDALYTYFATHPQVGDNPVAALPTGTGKSLIIAGWIDVVLKTWPGQRMMMLTHVKELIAQNADKLQRLWPQAPLGIYSAGLGQKSAHMPITFAGIQSAAKHPQLFGHQDIVIIDECHLVSPDENAMYKKFLGELRKKNPALRVIGLSATPYRLGLGMITDGGIFTDVAYDACSMTAFNRLLDDGYLAPLIPMQTQTVLDVSGVHKRGGDFIPAELQAAVGNERVTREALNEAAIAAADRAHWLIFTTGIDHCELVYDILSEMGIDTTYVHSKLPNGERDDNMRRFLSGEVRAMVNADILTTGFDFPAMDCIILLRPTSSPGLHVQILGRGTRPDYAPGFDLETTEGRLAAIEASEKKNCLVLDFAGNTRRLGPINDPRIPRKKGEGTGEIPIKVCDGCGCLNHISARMCVNCGEVFEFAEKLSAKASTIQLIVRDEPEVKEFKVDRVTYDTHVKPGFPPSLRVSYYCGMRRFTEWICLEHSSGVKYKAQAWWRLRSDVAPPTTIADAKIHVADLRVPYKIRVWINKKYPELLAHIFDEEKVC